MIVYRSEDQMFIMTEADEAEFITRYFGEEAPDPDDSDWDRFTVNGPVEVIRPETPNFVEVYDEYDV